MPRVSKHSPFCSVRSSQRSHSDGALCFDEQVLGTGGADVEDRIEYLTIHREQFDALKHDQEGVICCHNSMSADILVPRTATMTETKRGLQFEAGDDGSMSVLFEQQKRELERILVKWLNGEVRDRLESIDRKLQCLKERDVPRRRDSIQQRLTRYSSNSARVSLSSNESVPDLLGLERPNSDPTNVFGSRDVQDGSLASALAEKRHQCILSSIQSHEILRGRCAASVWRFMEDRFSSLAAYLWSFAIPGVVVVSLVVSFWQTIDNYTLHTTLGQILQASFETVFAAELLIRFFVCPDRRTFCRNPFNVIDLLTCLPLGCRLVFAIVSPDMQDVPGANILLPILRLLKLSPRFEKFLLLLDAFVISMEALPVLLYTMLIIAMAFSGMIYVAEPRENIANLPQAMWFVIVTMTTCGYGDIFPSTLLGQIICSVLMVVSILYTAMPIGIVGHAFSKAWDVRDRLLLMQRFREAFLQRGFSEAAFRDIVAVFVGDCDDELGFDEFEAMLQVMNINISADRVHMLLHGLDEDGSGKISVDELLGGLFPQDYATYFNHLKTATSSFTASSFIAMNSEQAIST